MCVLFVILSLFKNNNYIWGYIMKKITFNTKAKTIDEAFEEFQHFNKIKNLSDWTITTYEEAYKLFTDYYYRRKFM